MAIIDDPFYQGLLASAGQWPCPMAGFGSLQNQGCRSLNQQRAQLAAQAPASIDNIRRSLGNSDPAIHYNLKGEIELLKAERDRLLNETKTLMVPSFIVDRTDYRRGFRRGAFLALAACAVAFALIWLF